MLISCFFGYFTIAILAVDWWRRRIVDLYVMAFAFRNLFDLCCLTFSA